MENKVQESSKNQEPQEQSTFKDMLGLYIIVFIFCAALVGMILTAIYDK